MIYDEFCKNQNCNHYQEWAFAPNIHEQPYPCFSCDLVGQSYNVEKIPDECPFLEASKTFVQQRLSAEAKASTLPNGNVR